MGAGPQRRLDKQFPMTIGSALRHATRLSRGPKVRRVAAGASRIRTPGPTCDGIAVKRRNRATLGGDYAAAHEDAPKGFAPKSGSHRTPRWREMDSNRRSHSFGDLDYLVIQECRIERAAEGQGRTLMNRLDGKVALMSGDALDALRRIRPPFSGHSGGAVVKFTSMSSSLPSAHRRAGLAEPRV
jgi:hypothetical protein